jgi:hypothetical protein
MGTEVGRIEKEFVFKSLVDDNTTCDLHGARKEFRCRFSGITADGLELSPLEGKLEGFEPGDEVRVFFYLRNNYHTFASRVREATAEHVVLEQPPGVYKNLQRKYERVKFGGSLDVSFSLHGSKVELNFPKSERFNPVEPPEQSETFNPRRIQELVRAFRLKMETIVSDNKIVMLRDRLPKTWEEKTIVRLGKSLYIPSTTEDFPQRDPFPDGRLIVKSELIKQEEENGASPHVVASRLGNILYEKTKREIASELWAPLLYNEYVVGYIHVWNTASKRERIQKETVELVLEFAQILCFSLVKNGYFKIENSTERRFEAPIIDMSASGLLFAHTSADLVRDLLVHTDMEMTLRFEKRTIKVGARVMRKFRDAEGSYFGVLFLQMEPDDFTFLYQFLYGKSFDPAQEGTWEGGAPPPPLVII